MKQNQINLAHIAKLAALSLDKKKSQTYQAQLEDVLEHISSIGKLSLRNVPETHQVTQNTNVTREDAIDSTRVLTQSQALKNASKTHNGYFVVDAILKG
jgi:aspartyl/glutamyl-tRNA(Asn/Gln) amidotransferase C subunit